jgi:hypothetical protein
MDFRMATAEHQDLILAHLNRRYGAGKGLEFLPATDEVVAGLELEDSGNQSFGQNVFVSTRARFQPADGPPLLGKTIALDAVERYARGELRCQIQAGSGQVVVAVFAPDGRRLSRELTCHASKAGAYDEGLFVWFGPVESICTPWSDNDPDQCQVITLDRLREFAGRQE